MHPSYSKNTPTTGLVLIFPGRDPGSFKNVEGNIQLNGCLPITNKTRNFVTHNNTMTELIRTDSDNPDFIELVKQLDTDLAERDGDEHAFYARFNKIARIKHAVVAYEDGKPAGCGAIKEFGPGTMEVKRMYTLPGSRGKGMAGKVLGELERWAKELGCSKCVLETGLRQPEAIALYNKSGYSVIPNYGQYAGKYNSLCFEKSV